MKRKLDFTKLEGSPKKHKKLEADKNALPEFVPIEQPLELTSVEFFFQNSALQIPTYKNNASSRIDPIKKSSVPYVEQRKIEFYDACRTGTIESINFCLQNRLVDPSDDNNSAIRIATDNNHIEIVKLLLKQKKVDSGVNQYYCIRKACQNNNADLVKLLLNNKQVPKNVFDECIDIAFQNKSENILSLLYNDEKKIGFSYIKSAVAANNLHKVKLYLDYRHNCFNIKQFLQEQFISNQWPDLNDLILNHPKIDLYELFLFLHQYHHTSDNYTSLRNQIFDNKRFNVNSLIAHCYQQELFETDYVKGLKEQLFSNSNLNFSIVFEELNKLSPMYDLESLLVDLYQQKLLSIEIINELLNKEYLSINHLVNVCYMERITLTENELVAQLINNYKLCFSDIFKSLEPENKKEGLFKELYLNKFISLDRIIEENIILENSLDIARLLYDFFDTKVFHEDIKFREHLLNHPCLHTDVETQQNIYHLFKQFSQTTKPNSDEKLYNFEQLELLVPVVQKTLQQNKEILNDYYDFIDSEEDSIRKKQLIDVLIRPIYEKTRFFPQAATNSKLHLPELWDMIAKNMMHHTLGTEPIDDDLNNKPKL